MLIPKRPKEKASVYRSRDFRRKLREKIAKWSPRRVFVTLYTKFDTKYNPYACDWFSSTERTRVMQARAEALFDAWEITLRVHADKLKNHFNEFQCAKKIALEQWCKIQSRVDKRSYCVVGSTILPKNTVPETDKLSPPGDAIEEARLQLVLSLSK